MIRLMKNLTPRKIGLLVASVTGLTAAVCGALFFREPWEVLVITVLIFGVTFAAVNFLIENFIYRKIKLIYKTIHSFKAGKEGASMIREKLSDDESLEEVNREVMEWQKEKAEEIEELKQVATYRKEFVANVSHELKTPLFNIQGYIFTLLDGAIDDKEVNRIFLSKAARNVERLVSLTSDLEIISQLETGNYSLEKEVFDVNALTHEVFESLEIKALKRKITLAIKKGCDIPFYVYADKDKIRQVLVNLIDNSIKYGKENGNTVLSFYDMDENILVEVTDDGIGMEEEHLPRLFERFYRADKHRSRDLGGTGLGLAIVKHIIEAHNQTINVRSTVNVGTTFGFTLVKK